MPVHNRDRQVLEKIIRYCDEIEFSHEEYQRSFKRFSENPTYRNAVALCLMQIGELTGKLSEEFKNEILRFPGVQSEECVMLLPMSMAKSM